MARRWRRRWRAAVLALLLLAFGLAAIVAYRSRGPYRSYRVDLAVAAGDSAGAAPPLLAGAAVRDITPHLEDYDSWTDANGDGLFDPAQGDTCRDDNHNGRCDLVWLAGFAPNRPAQGINDPLTARALVLRQGGVSVALVAIDAIGLTHENVIALRQSIDQAALGLTHVLVAATHTHDAPDTLGLWSNGRLGPLLTDFDQGYLDRVLTGARDAVLEALAHLTPAELQATSATLPSEGFVRDSRPPIVYDHTLAAARFVAHDSGETIATLVSWGNHPEALGAHGRLISADYPHYWREGVERGLPPPNGCVGLGGVCLFFVGPIGGLMTPSGVTVPERDGQGVVSEDGVNKARALGERLSHRTVQLLTDPSLRPEASPRLALVARTVFVPIEGVFRWPIILGLIHPGWFSGRARTEIDALRLGELEILAVPGELYPEISEGGVESPPGADFPGPPREVPPLRSQMRGSVRMIFGLANDELGYLIPRTEWDTRPPFAYGRDQTPYGEIVSGGPGVAEVVHHESLGTLTTLHDLVDKH